MYTGVFLIAFRKGTHYQMIVAARELEKTALRRERESGTASHRKHRLNPGVLRGERTSHSEGSGVRDRGGR